jgi:release factor glutamine methyltransferase
VRSKHLPPPGATTVARLVREGADILPRRSGIPDPAREASWLLAAALNESETWLKIHPEAEVAQDIRIRYRSWISLRAAGFPAEHLVGKCRFWDRDFSVSPQVLIPRPETELLIERTLGLPLPESTKVLDVGTGSGCIAVTLAAERPRWRIVGVDRSPAALLIARNNGRTHRTAVSWLVGSLGTALRGPFDLVVANLPYLPTEWLENLPMEVHREPSLALDGGPDGLALVRQLLADLRRLVRAGGWCLLELAEGQADVLDPEVQALGFGAMQRIRDPGGCDRIVVLQCGG